MEDHLASSRALIGGTAEYLAPVAKQLGFSDPYLLWRGSEVLCVYRGAPFCLLIYCAMGHGVNMTVAVAKAAPDRWNPEGELGLGWLCDMLGAARWDSARRYDSSSERNCHIKELAERLPDLLSLATTYGPHLWRDLRQYSENKLKDRK